jgi:hypothetical protein
VRAGDEANCWVPHRTNSSLFALAGPKVLNYDLICQIKYSIAEAEPVEVARDRRLQVRGDRVAKLDRAAADPHLLTFILAVLFYFYFYSFCCNAVDNPTWRHAQHWTRRGTGAELISLRNRVMYMVITPEAGTRE